MSQTSDSSTDADATDNSGSAPSTTDDSDSTASTASTTAASSALCDSVAVMTTLAASGKVFACSPAFAAGITTPCVSYLEIPADVAGFPDSIGSTLNITTPTTPPPADESYYYICYVSFNTTLPDTRITITATCSATGSSTTPSTLIIGRLDSDAKDDPQRTELSPGQSATLDVLVPDVGSHYVELIFDNKDSLANSTAVTSGQISLASADSCAYAIWNCLSGYVCLPVPPFTPVSGVTNNWGCTLDPTTGECTPFCLCPCGCSDAQIANCSVRANDGSVNQSSPNISISASGFLLLQTLEYTNLLAPNAIKATYNANDLPNSNWLYSSQARILFFEENENHLCVFRGPKNTLWFYRADGAWNARFGAPYTLTENANGFLLFNQESGVSSQFNGKSDPSSVLDGLLVSETLANGTTTAAYNYDTTGALQNISVPNSAGTSADTLVYSRDANNRLASVVFTGQTGAQRLEYTYYETDGNNGREGDLQTVTLKNGATAADAVIQHVYYRYYGTDDTSVFPHALQYVLESASWDKMTAASLDPTTADDTTLAAYADRYFEYDDQKRAIKVSIAGGSQTYKLSYTQSRFWKEFNGWLIKTIINRPDNAIETVYSNGYKQTMLRVLQDASGTNTWYLEGNTYNNSGQKLLQAANSAINTIDEEGASLFTIKADAGLVRENEWLTNGATKDYLSARYIRRGNSDNSTRTKLESYAYTTRTVNGETLILLSSRTTYSGESEHGDDPAQTSFSYTFFAAAAQMQQRTTNLPLVSADENGTDNPVSQIEVLDTLGRVIWTLDGRGEITRFFYVDETSALLQRIDDVDTTQVTDAPAGWETLPGFGLHLTTDYESDFLGRTTLALGPLTTIDIGGVATPSRTASYTVYQDATHEVWTAQGNATGSAGNYTYTTISPVSIIRTDSSGKITDAISATYNGTGRLSPTDSFPQTSWSAWTHNEYNDAGQLSETRNYFNIPASGAGTSGTNYKATTYGYDVMGRQNRVQSSGGTIIKTVFDVRDLQTEVWLGTDDSGGSTDSMSQTSAFIYDNATDKGDGLLTTQTLYEFAAGDTEPQARNTTYTYDWRDRQVSALNEINVYTGVTYDNQDRVIATEVHSGASGGTLLAKTQTLYDARGRAFRNLIYNISGGGTAGNPIATDSWFDEIGNLIKQRKAGQRIYTKTVFDGLSRPIKSYSSYMANGEDDGATNNVTADIVVEQVYTDYDAASNVIGKHSYLRFHDLLASTTGALTGPDDPSPKARVYHTFAYPDSIGRTVATADYGTNGGTTPTRPVTIPAVSDTVLVTRQSYDPAGNLFEITDPEGRITHTEYDALRRIVKKVENYIEDNTSTTSDTNKTTLYTYAPDGGIATLTLENATTGDQVTTWQYGTTLADSGVATSNLLSLKISPDDSTATPDRIAYTYTRQQLLKTQTDPNGNVHTYNYDLAARRTTDIVSTLGATTNGAVRRIEATYDDLNRLIGTTSYDSVSGGNIVNDTQQSYNSFGQITSDAQAHTGAVDSNTPTVNYDYVGGVNNCITWLGTNYPDARQVDAEFDTTLDTMLGRPGSLHDSIFGGVIATYSYLGRSTVVNALYPEPNIKLTYLQQTGDPVGNGGDQYFGLDRFGRIIDHRWTTYTSPVTDLDRYQYGYNRASLRTYRANLVSAAQTTPVYLDELYQYDGLNQITNRQLGQLSADHTSIIGTPTQQEGFTLDPAGNWDEYQQTNNGTSTIDQTRTHNTVNEITAIDGSASRVGFDPAGNMTTIPSDQAATASPFTTTWDAWNRLVRVQGGTDNIDISYQYDGLSRRTRQIVTSGTAPSLDFYYNNDWKIIEERLIDTSDATTNNVRAQYLFGVRDRNDLIFQDFSPDGIAADTRYYILSDAMYSTTAIATSDGTIQQRIYYSAFGVPTFTDAGFLSASNAIGHMCPFLFDNKWFFPDTRLYDCCFLPNAGRNNKRGFGVGGNSYSSPISSQLNGIGNFRSNTYATIGLSTPSNYHSPRPFFGLSYSWCNFQSYRDGVFDINASYCSKQNILLTPRENEGRLNPSQYPSLYDPIWESSYCRIGCFNNPENLVELSSSQQPEHGHQSLPLNLSNGLPVGFAPFLEGDKNHWGRLYDLYEMVRLFAGQTRQYTNVSRGQNLTEVNFVKFGNVSIVGGIITGDGRGNIKIGGDFTKELRRNNGPPCVFTFGIRISVDQIPVYNR